MGNTTTILADHTVDIEQYIRQGINSAYLENLRMTLNSTLFSDRIIEYHIVVCLAQALMPWASSRGIAIEPEYGMRDFYNKAYPQISVSGANMFSIQMKGRADHNPSGNKQKRIDLALTYEGDGLEGERVLAGIEVKAINRLKKSIIKDIHRLALAMQNTEDNTDNSIQAGYSLFYRNLHNGKTILYKEKLKKKKEATKQDWESEIAHLTQVYPTLVFELEEKVIFEMTGEELGDKYLENDYSDAALETGLIICYLIKIKRKDGGG